MMKTYRTKTKITKTADVKRQWRLLDGQGKILGRLASEIAVALQGKDKPSYTPNIDGGDYVVVINASQIVLTRGKADTKLYIRHSNYPGGLSKENFASLQKRKPEEVVVQAVKNMLPNNRLKTLRLARLKVYGGSEHPHGSYIGGKSKQEK